MGRITVSGSVIVGGQARKHEMISVPCTGGKKVGNFRISDGKIQIRSIKNLDIEVLNERVEGILKERYNHERARIHEALMIWQNKKSRTTREYNRLTGELDKLDLEEDITNLRNETRRILESFGKLPKRDLVIGLSTRVSKDDAERVKLIEEYLFRLSKYVYVEIPHTPDKFNPDICPNCDAKVCDNPISNKNRYCLGCGLELVSFCNENVSSDLDGSGSRSGYEDRSNFYKALLCYQGKQPWNPPANLMKDLDEYFSSYGLPTSEQVLKMPFDERGRKPGTSRDMMTRALRVTGHYDQYENIHLICYRYWGWILPDVSHLEQQIMRDYDITQRIYEQLPRERKSSINTQLRLRYHLLARGHECLPEDFKIVNYQESIDEQERMLKIMTIEANKDLPEGEKLVYYPLV